MQSSELTQGSEAASMEASLALSRTKTALRESLTCRHAKVLLLRLCICIRFPNDCCCC